MRAADFITEDDHVYHGTAQVLVPFIRHGGLDPEASSGGLTWFAKDQQEAQRYAEVHRHQLAGPKRAGALLRVSRSHLPADALRHLSYSDVTATAQHIPPEHIELLQPDGSWQPLVQLDEGFASDRIHKNPTISTLKALAKDNKYGSARFVIYDDGTLVAGDSGRFTHRDIAPAMGAWYLRGYIQHLSGDDYAYRTMGPYDHLPKDHPLLRKFERAGIEDGNDIRTTAAVNEGKLTPKHIHDLADAAGVPWNDDPDFMDLTQRITGHRHLDDLDQHQLEIMADHMRAYGK